MAIANLATLESLVPKRLNQPTSMKLDRRLEVLKAIVQHFVETAEPVGSNTILVSYNFQVSPATIRNDMASLEKEGLIFQPHTSSGRVPTDLGYRLYVEELGDYEQARREAKLALASAQKELQMHKVKQKIHDIVSLLAHVTGVASFATVPDNPRTFYIGLSNIIRQPEFIADMSRASQVIEVFEQSDRFLNILKELDIDENIKFFIGKENLIPEIQSCTLMVTTIKYMGHKSVIGLLAPTRTNYAFNRAVLEQIKKLI
jgi:transcriptional regulator of heat shock response